MSSKTSQRISCNSNFKMHCFVCNKAINRGDEITQTLESGGMELRNVPYTGSRWVNAFCLPKDETTLYFMDVVDDMQKSYPECDFDEIMDMVENHDYWYHEGQDARSPRPPTPPRPASNDHLDSDDDDDEYVYSYFGPLKVDPIEKAEFEKTVDETIEMLKKKDQMKLEKINREADRFIFDVTNNREM